MSYTTELTEDFMGIVHAGSGIVTGADLIKACKETAPLLQTTENFHYEFIDFSDVTELKITPTDLEQIVEQDRFAALFRPDAVVVIVAPRAELFEIGKKWEQLVQNLGWKIHICHTRSEGIAWLRANYPIPKPPREKDPEESVPDSSAP
jgi:hypothetical protein